MNTGIFFRCKRRKFHGLFLDVLPRGFQLLVDFGEQRTRLSVVSTEVRKILHRNTRLLGRKRRFQLSNLDVEFVCLDGMVPRLLFELLLDVLNLLVRFSNGRGGEIARRGIGGFVLGGGTYSRRPLRLQLP